MLQAGVDFATVDLFRTPLRKEQLGVLAAGQPVPALFSWKSPQARTRGLRPGDLSDETLLTLMAEEPRLIRRPLVFVDGELIIGADVDRIRALLRRAPGASEP